MRSARASSPRRLGPDVFRQVADEVCFLDGGRVLERGPAGQVLGDPVEPRTRQFLRRIIEAGRL